tara:strand:+ start:3211 stop:4251 length:1041 start_codon:yes stop_codon:yes gene_type:complete
MRNKYTALLNQLKLSDTPEPVNRNDRVLIIDGLNTFIRAYAVSPALNTNGEHVGGITGFLMSIGSAIKQINPSRVVIVFDGKDGSAKRKKLFPDYKANRKFKIRLNRAISVTAEDTQLKQLMMLIDYLELLPITMMTLDNAEADDIIAYLANEYFVPKESQVFIMSSDKDFLQLASSQIHIWSPTKKKMYFVDDVYSEYQIHPKNLSVFRALVGDNSDNIPGAKGLAPKTIIKRFPKLVEEKEMSLDDFFAYAKELGKDSKIKVYKNVTDGEKDVRLYHKIMQLHESTLISTSTKQRAVNLAQEPNKKLAKMAFHQMLLQDGMTGSMRNVEMWLRDVCTKLDQFAE